MRRLSMASAVDSGKAPQMGKYNSAIRFIDARNNGMLNGSGVMIAPRFALSVSHLFQGGFSQLIAQNQPMISSAKSGISVSRIHFVEYGTYAIDEQSREWPPPIETNWRLDEICLVELESPLATNYPRLESAEPGAICTIAGYGRNYSDPNLDNGNLLTGPLRIRARDFSNPGFFLMENFSHGDVFPESDDSGCPYYLGEDDTAVVGLQNCSLRSNGERFAVFRSIEGYEDWIKSTIGAQ